MDILTLILKYVVMPILFVASIASVVAARRQMVAATYGQMIEKRSDKYHVYVRDEYQVPITIKICDDNAQAMAFVDANGGETGLRKLLAAMPRATVVHQRLARNKQRNQRRSEEFSRQVRTSRARAMRQQAL